MENKRELLKNLITRKIDLKHIRSSRILEFKEYSSSPGIYWDCDGNQLSEADVKRQVASALQSHPVVISEIKVYE